MLKEDIDAIKWIHSRRTFGPKPGLMRVEKLLELVGNPEKNIPTIHIAGTNGKGSTVSYLKSIFMEEGKSVATFTSPYIEVFNERIAINDMFIADDDLTRLVEKIKPLVAQMDQTEEYKDIAEFEIITVLAFMYFEEKEPDIALIEVGLGGLFDSTNVIKPIVTAITTIGLDHMEILGDSLDKIAFQKAGIIKEGVPLITGNIEDIALDVIKKQAMLKNADIYEFSKDYKVEYHPDNKVWGEEFNFINEKCRIEDLHIALQGKHQIENAALALEIYYIYCKLEDKKFSKKIVRPAMEHVIWPARMEKLSDEPLIILDGAHNSHAIKSLVDNLNNEFPNYKKNILFSALETKDIKEMITLLGHADNSKLYLTTFAYPKALELDAYKDSSFEIYEDWHKAINSYKKDLKAEELLIITGSLYFMSQVRQYMIDSK